MRVNPKELKRLLRGAVVELVRPKDFHLHAGRSYAVQREGNRAAQIARMDCLECFSDEFGWHYKVRLSREVPARLLAQRSEMGYTSDRHRALKDEPEAVPEAWLSDHLSGLEGYVKLSRAQDAEERLEACRTFEERLVALRSIARSHGVDCRSEFRLLDQLRRDGKVERVHRLAVRVEDKIRKQAA